jgi:uncharacterized protein YbjT (DUF2867 family)
MVKTAVVIGATGLVGQQLVEQLLQHPAYNKVTLLLRRPLPIEHLKLKQVLFDFDHPDSALVQGDHLYCAIGTTLKKAGSQEAQFKIDCTYPAVLGELARKNGFSHYLLVSSVGANRLSSNFYLRTKGELEHRIEQLGFEGFVAARPSFLLGARSEMRLGERIGIAIAQLIGPLLIGPLRRYRGIQAAQVAKGLIRLAQTTLQRQVLVAEYDELMKG